MIDPKIEEIRERADGRAKDPWTDDDERDCGLIETWCPGKMAADVVSLLNIIDEHEQEIVRLSTALSRETAHTMSACGCGHYGSAHTNVVLCNDCLQRRLTDSRG